MRSVKESFIHGLFLVVYYRYILFIFYRLHSFTITTWFERLSMLVILVNCACLALADPLDRNCSEIKCKRLKKVNVFVLWFFVAEMIMKMTAVGVVGKRSYFSDGWNRLDFVIVAAG